MAVLEREDLSSIALNIDPQIDFSSGPHAGELNLTISHLGLNWAKRMKGIPMLAVEFVALRPKSSVELVYEVDGDCLGDDIRRLLPIRHRFRCHYHNRMSVLFPPPKPESGDSFAVDQLVTGCRMVAPLASPSLELHNMVPPLRLHHNTKLRSGPTDEWRVIHYGYMLHVDFAITALGMNTDTQHLAYVLRKSLPPSSLFSIFSHQKEIGYERCNIALTRDLGVEKRGFWK